MADLDTIEDKIERLDSKVEQLMRRVDEIYREVGAREGRELRIQIDEIQRKAEANEHRMNEISRDVTAIRRAVDFGDNNFKDIKQALALIYKNTDELEAKLIGSDRETY